MDFFEEAAVFISKLPAVKLQRLVLIAILVSLFFIGSLIYVFHSYSVATAQQIQNLYTHQASLISLKGKINRLRDEKERIENAFEENFNLRVFMQKIMEEQKIDMPLDSQEDIIDLDTTDLFDEATISFTIANITTKKLVSLLKAFHGVHAYIKTITLNKSSTATINVNMTVAALKQKYIPEE